MPGGQARLVVGRRLDQGHATEHHALVVQARRVGRRDVQAQRARVIAEHLQPAAVQRHHHRHGAGLLAILAQGGDGHLVLPGQAAAGKSAGGEGRRRHVPALEGHAIGAVLRGRDGQVQLGIQLAGGQRPGRQAGGQFGRGAGVQAVGQ
ncbi:hypothetical protein D3C78_1568640 [compost metagenome]